MIRLVPDSIAGRIILTLFLGLTISHFISIMVFTSEKLEAITLVGKDQIIERIAEISRHLAEIPKEYRGDVIAIIDTPLFRVSRGPLAGAAPGRDQGDVDEAERIAAQLRAQTGKAAVEISAVRSLRFHDDQGLTPLLRLMMLGQLQVVEWLHGHVDDREIAAQVTLSGGDVITFASHPLRLHGSVIGHATLSVLIMAASTFLFSLIIVRYLTVPLTRVARAAERFGQDLSAPPLPEVGAAEARAVARAFNEMNRRIRQFVEDRTRMIAAISHDLRTPITLLRLRTEFITDPDERARMRATLAEMEGMIAATLAFARDDAADEPRLRVDLAALLSSICYDMADAGLPVRFEPESKVSLECRPGALRRALTNLLDNSVKYGGGARVSLAESEREIRILIDDDGPGIAEAEQEAVFRPFYRLEPSRNREFGGVGLGLSVARTIIHGHGGAITLANRPEGGLRVTLTLPLNPNTG